jgi:hypothetical protein
MWDRSSPGLYNAATNPGGVRCTLQDYMVSMLGKRGDGFANRPFDNVGVQYGLAALKAGTISLTQFIDLNTLVGGIDINDNPVTTRSEADVAACPGFIAAASSSTVNSSPMYPSSPYRAITIRSSMTL